MIQNWHILITGFTQSEQRETGMERLWSNLRSLSTPTTSIQLRTWNDNFDGLANFMKRRSVVAPRICIYAYSWGVGRGFIQLCKALKKEHVYVDHAVLCDGVYYNFFLPSRALTSWSKIVIPDNVLQVSWFRQKQNKPAGHSLKAANPKTTTISDEVVLPYDHCDMDDSPEFQMKALEVAGVYRQPPPHVGISSA